MSRRVVIITVVLVVVVGAGAMYGLGIFRSRPEPVASQSPSGTDMLVQPAMPPQSVAQVATATDQSIPAKPKATSKPTSAPVAAPIPPVVSADGTIVLSAAGARIIGTQLHLEHPALPNLAYWVDPLEYPEWRHWVPKQGKYGVEVTYSCAPNSGGRFRIFAGGASVVGAAEVTGGWDKYRTVTLPDALMVPNDWCTITMKCEGNPNHALMDLQRIRLIPAH